MTRRPRRARRANAPGLPPKPLENWARYGNEVTASYDLLSPEVHEWATTRPSWKPSFAPSPSEEPACLADTTVFALRQGSAALRVRLDMRSGWLDISWKCDGTDPEDQLCAFFLSSDRGPLGLPVVLGNGLAGEVTLKPHTIGIDPRACDWRLVVDTIMDPCGIRDVVTSTGDEPELNPYQGEAVLVSAASPQSSASWVSLRAALRVVNPDLARSLESVAANVDALFTQHDLTGCFSAGSSSQDSTFDFGDDRISVHCIVDPDIGAVTLKWRANAGLQHLGLWAVFASDDLGALLAPPQSLGLHNEGDATLTVDVLGGFDPRNRRWKLLVLPITRS